MPSVGKRGMVTRDCVQYIDGNWIIHRRPPKRTIAGNIFRFQQQVIAPVGLNDGQVRGISRMICDSKKIGMLMEARTNSAGWISCLFSRNRFHMRGNSILFWVMMSEVIRVISGFNPLRDYPPGLIYAYGCRAEGVILPGPFPDTASRSSILFTPFFSMIHRDPFCKVPAGVDARAAVLQAAWTRVTEISSRQSFFSRPISTMPVKSKTNGRPLAEYRVG